jgi:hypothetical protein
VSDKTPLLDTRGALVLILGVLAGLIAGVLTFMAGDNLAAAALAGLAGSGGATLFFNQLIS